MRKISYVVIAGLLQLLSLFPLTLLRQFGKGVGALFWLANGRSRRVTEENLSICFPDMPVLERTTLAKKSLQQLGIMMLELGFVWRRPPQQLLATIATIEGKEYLDEAMGHGKGVIVLGPHLGNWEVVGPYLGHHHTITIMYQPPDNPALEKVMISARERNGVTLVPTDRSGVKAQLRALRRGEMVGILPDQVPPLESGDFAPFFNTPALTAVMSFNLIQRTGARAIIAYARRMDNSGHFHLVFEPALDQIYSEDKVTALTALNKSIENCVLKIPEQYQWEYKRFKKQPGGERKYYQN